MSHNNWIVLLSSDNEISLLTKFTAFPLTKTNDGILLNSSPNIFCSPFLFIVKIILENNVKSVDKLSDDDWFSIYWVFDVNIVCVLIVFSSNESWGCVIGKIIKIIIDIKTLVSFCTINYYRYNFKYK